MGEMTDKQVKCPMTFICILGKKSYLVTEMTVSK